MIRLQIQHHPSSGLPIFMHNNLHKWHLDVAPKWDDYPLRWVAATRAGWDAGERFGVAQYESVERLYGDLGYDPERRCWEALVALRCVTWFQRRGALLPTGLLHNPPL
jgi:hypothetical protein